jgi:hypothetical protein
MLAVVHGAVCAAELQTLHYGEHYLLTESNVRPGTRLAIATCLVVGLTHQATGGEIDFARDIAPILEEHCWYCHGEDEQESGLRLDRRGSMLRGGDYGLPTIVPGKPEKSYLVEVINHRDPDMAMPPDEDKLPAERIALLTRWIKEGAIWPGQMEAVARQKSDHWSFQPIERPAIPAMGNGEQTVAYPIDAFLLQRLREHGLSFSDPAEPRALIRRASIVLTGLPPTPAETQQFLSEYTHEPEAAYSGLIDRLLDSPHFGERWAQHWLDVIRWAETNGSESNLYRKNAWIYRDYVIRSFNEDKPSDQFLLEQIAGDTVGVGEATGFLVAGPHVPVATVGQEPAARRQARADRMDEILQTVGAAALGVTIGCARCHNHKFDPISIRDYYSMAAAFQDIEFGSRFPELAEDHPRRLRGEELYRLIAQQRSTLRNTGPWEENWTGYKEVHFPAVKTQAIRVSFMWQSARIDELEIFGIADWNNNLARAAGTEVKSDKKMEVPRGELHKINDGRYGTEAWAARVPKGSQARPWIQFTFDRPHALHRIRLSTNRQDYWQTDYLEGMNKFAFGPYKVEVLNEDGNWKQVAATAQMQPLNKKHEPRAAALKQLHELINQLAEEGPQPSFVARLIRPAKTHVFNRGSPEDARDEVFAAGLKELDGELNLPPDARGKQRRTALARWLISPDHPLTARVAANRLWHHVFGKGIVTTTSDFGAAGAPPTHPELLDWLAAELMQPTVAFHSPQAANNDDAAVAARKATLKPWSMKHLIRLMVMSRAFRQSSLPREQGLAVDAGSSRLWRFPPRRMAAEAIRDSIVQASGSLDRAVGGRSYRIHNVKKRYAQWEVTDNHGPHTWRRMIYQERMRRVDDRMFTAFDFPDCGQVRAKRPVSTTPLQALNLMNSDFVIQQAKRIAARAESESGGRPAMAVNRCFELLLGRAATPNEQKSCLQLADKHDLAIVCRALINSNEFAFLP